MFVERFNQTVLYFSLKYDAKKVHARVEVRPKDINLDTNVWKSMEEYEPPLKAEEDRKEVDLDPVFSEVNSEESEQDWDKVYHKNKEEELLQHLAPQADSYKADAQIRAVYSEPEKDEDEMYQIRVYLQPPEDKDDIYHKDVKQLPFQSAPKAAASIDVPSQRKYSEPEEDLDDLYHPWSLIKQTNLRSYLECQ